MKPAAVLPPAAAKLLQQAAAAPIPASDPLARVKAIEQAIQRVRTNHPEYFKQEQSK